MSRIQTFFENQPNGTEDLSQGQLALLMTLSRLPQEELVNDENLEAWSHRKHPRNPAVRKMKKHRMFKALMEFHEQFSDGISLSYPYTLWLMGLCKRKTDVYLYHAESIFRAKQLKKDIITLGFWCDNVCPEGLWKATEWKKRWKAQKQDGQNLLEDAEAWKELHTTQFETA